MDFEWIVRVGAILNIFNIGAVCKKRHRDIQNSTIGKAEQFQSMYRGIY